MANAARLRHVARLSATTAFNPPNANAFDITARTGVTRAAFGT
jgi:hypothetical protein